MAPQCANVAQLFRALPCQGRGRELESLHSHHFRTLRNRIIKIMLQLRKDYLEEYTK